MSFIINTWKIHLLFAPGGNSMYILKVAEVAHWLKYMFAFYGNFRFFRGIQITLFCYIEAGSIEALSASISAFMVFEK